MPAWSIKSKSFVRHPLGDALDGMISGLVALEARVNLTPLVATLSGARAQAAAQTTRLREVLDRDRALVAAGAPQRVTNAAPVAEAAIAQAEPSAPEPRPELEPAKTNASTPSVTCTEPIRTRTMARLLGAQGHKERALSIYDLLCANDDDPELRAEAERLRAQPA
jgi:hypothetical protein